jgi:adenosylcobinamide kinase/adenosylcobinamide-phosphate guanylyltransferase
MRHVTLVTGGGRSGKSRYGLNAALAYARRVFVATAVPCDPEMADRIARHRAERGDAFRTIEAQTRVADAIREHGPTADVVLVDCITIWVNNLLHERERGGVVPDTEIAAFLDTLRAPPCDLILVTNEVGMGIVPVGDLTREYRDLVGMVNQQVAALADRVVFTVCGLPIVLKGQDRAP